MNEREELSVLIYTEIEKTPHRFPQTDDYLRAADAVLAAGWRAPLPPCEHRFVVFAGVCQNCGHRFHKPSAEDLGTAGSQPVPPPFT